MASQVVKKFGGKRKGYRGKKWKIPSAATIGTNALWYGLDPGAYHGFAKALFPFLFKKGGRVRGVGKATHGFGKVMGKK